jgi:hypothetical protein
MNTSCDPPLSSLTSFIASIPRIEAAHLGFGLPALTIATCAASQRMSIAR